jgi:peptidoglycan-associated lipoprotein
MKIAEQYSIAILAITALACGACAKKVAAVRPSAVTSPAPVVASSSSKPVPARAESPTAPAPVQAPKPRYPDAATRARIDQLLAKIEDAYFDYDKASLRPDAIQTLAAASSELRNILRDYPDYKLTIEGHCDERGSAEYNLALGDQRATAAKDYLVQVGIPGDQLSVVSYGKERPACSQSDESCWQKNRRIHIVAMAALKEK